MSRILRSSVFALATLTAAGCANFPGAAGPGSEPPPEPDYRKIVADNVKGNLKDAASLGPLQISAIKRTTLTQAGDWTVCVKGMRKDRPVYFAVFISDHKVEKWGESVIVDHCDAEQYEPLPVPEEPAPMNKAPAKPPGGKSRKPVSG